MTGLAHRWAPVALACAALAVTCEASAADAAGPGRACRPGSTHVLSVRVVPRFARVRFLLDGRPFVSGRDGIARVAVPGCRSHRLTVVPPRRLRRGVHATFARWGDEAFAPSRTVRLTRDTQLEVGFDVRYLVTETFVDPAGRPVDTRAVSWLVQSNSLGSHERFRPGVRRWLIGSRVIRRTTGLQAVEVLYSVRQAVMHGTNAVRQAEQRFYPARSQNVRIRLLLYSAAISSRDRLFGFPIGSGLELTYPNGHRERVRLGKRSQVALTLPRGTYTVKVDGPGLESSVPIALTRDQVVELRMVSYIDLAVVGELLLLAVIALLVVRSIRKHRQRQQGLGRVLQAYSETLRAINVLAGGHVQPDVHGTARRPVGEAPPRARPAVYPSARRMPARRSS